MNKIKVPYSNCVLGCALLMLMSSCLYGQKSSPSGKNSGYLFVYFTGNSKPEEAIRFAISNDGYHFRALNNNNPVLSSGEISSTGGVRDPHILRGNDGKSFYMVATDMVSALG